MTSLKQSKIKLQDGIMSMLTQEGRVNKLFNLSKL